MCVCVFCVCGCVGVCVCVYIHTYIAITTCAPLAIGEVGVGVYQRHSAARIRDGLMHEVRPRCSLGRRFSLAGGFAVHWCERETDEERI